MQINHLLSAILRGPWLIDEQVADSYLPTVLTLIQGQPIPQEVLDRKESGRTLPFAVALAGAHGIGTLDRYADFDAAPAGSVAITPIVGPLMREDDCGDPGMATIGRRFQAADSHENVAAHVLYVNSGGGTVDYTEILAGIFKNARKPVVAYVDGIMASAAYWLGSNARRIVVGAHTATIGSIGTQISMVSRKKAMEAAGYEFHTVRATESTDKNEAYLQLLDGKYELIRQQVLDPMNSVFLNAVRANREGKLADPKKENTLTGKTYLGADAIAHGLADQMGSFEHAVQLALQLAEEPNQDSNQTSPNANSDMSLLNKIKAAITAAAAVSGSATIVTTEAQVAAINEQLEAAGITGVAVITEAQFDQLQAACAERDTLQASVETLTSANTQLTASLQAACAERDTLSTANAELTTANATLTQERAAAQALAEQYGSQPGAVATSPVKTGNDLSEEGISAQSEIDELPHNKALAGNPLFS